MYQDLSIGPQSKGHPLLETRKRLYQDLSTGPESKGEEMQITPYICIFSEVRHLTGEIRCTDNNTGQETFEGHSKHSKKSKFPPSNRDFNFQIICHIISSITLLCGEFNNAHLDTSFASIDPKILKLCPIEGTYPEI